MTCPDTSVIVPALGRWHRHHVRARRALGRPTAVVGHCLFEAYSVLTRMPEPYRTSPDIAADSLDGLFAGATVFDAGDAASVLMRLKAARVGGGATYDGLIALTAADHQATILTLDERAAPTYRACGVSFELIS